jgi:mono/diheme cytochrome c family protein
MGLKKMSSASAGFILAVAIGLGGPARSQALPPAKGRALAQRNCAMCHAIGPHGASPNPTAPPFRDLHKRFAMDDLEAGMLSDLLAGHPSMPEFRLSPAEVHDLLDYLKSLAPQKSAEVKRPGGVGADL